LPSSLLLFSVLLKSKLVARKQGRCAEKASAQLFRIADFGFRIFLVFFFNPHSAIGIPQFGGGPIGRPAGRPYNGITLFSGERMACPPSP
jgi:hypothetical protein